MDENNMQHDGIFIYINGRRVAEVGGNSHEELARHNIHLIPHYTAAARPAAKPVDLAAERVARAPKGTKPGPR